MEEYLFREEKIRYCLKPKKEKLKIEKLLKITTY